MILEIDENKRQQEINKDFFRGMDVHILLIEPIEG